MTAPTLSKTWQLNINQLVLSKIDGNQQGGAILRVIKNSLKGVALSPWTVQGSSNAGGTTGSPTGSAGMDGVDRWTLDSDIATGGSNGRHAWIVLRQTGIATNFEFCWDLNNTSSISAGVFVISPSAGFTGGSATARPTATDEIVVQNATGFFSGSITEHRVHVWQSTDGQCTRVIIWNNGSNLETFWLLDKPQNAISGWTNPSVVTMFEGNGISISYFLLTSGGRSTGKGTTTIGINYTGESIVSTGLVCQIVNAADIANDFDGTWTFYPIGLFSVTASNRGRLGTLADIWWKSVSINDGDTFPNNSTTLNFVAFGCLIFPWTGDSTVPYIA